MVTAKRSNADTLMESAPSSLPITDMEAVLSNSAKKTRIMFSTAYSQAAMDEQESQRIKLTSKINDEYQGLGKLPDVLIKQQKEAAKARMKAKTTTVEEAPAETEESTAEGSSVVSKLIESIEEKPKLDGKNEGVVAIRHKDQYTPDIFGDSIAGGGSLVRRARARIIRPVWHAPWKLMRVISGHLGWVRAVAVEPGNKWFATGAGDRTIKIWDLASGTLKLSLTGHISTVRALEVSPRHPYLFSCGEDKMVKCWDLEQNKVIRHYHGHLSGVYSLSLHPTLDVLVTSGRDATARVWDMRTKQAIHVLTGHTSTVSAVKCQEADPQVITGSMDSTMRLWDLAAGKTMGVLTHHKKSVRAIALHPTEFGFVSGSADAVKGWKCPEGTFIQNYERRKAIINTISVNQDGVIFSGGDDGSLGFNDWKSGYNFQSMETTVQPGSLDAEAGIFCSTFDKTGSRLITGEADKTIKIYKEDENAVKDEDFYQ
ncbi:WD40 repeat-like protein [Rhizopus microsporus var. microsporus]|uniref:WD40 repeat-like protein n=2 Tax=Rhizopus microsporus TaxID=58291 RepID=A0A2G4T1P3_RHIZD|nr:WD40 repeat-like protein [Rhizopus microsporus ATCC 52813]ORE04733.1 WD40 repeat-like protein [Rhizopus microsporus var. microsporus]PHZ14586.1 WD40 repeat-like protein [Rhizopus microsporus ATCC 52813]